MVLTPVFGALFFAVHPPRAAWLAAGVSALGLLLLSGTGGSFRLSGDGVVFLCACAFALHILVTARAVRRFDVGALVAIQLGACGLLCLGAAALGGELEVPRGGTVWSALIVTSLVASALGFLVQSYAQQHAPPARTALILAAEPAFAGLFGYLLADERLSAAGVARCGADPGRDRAGRRGAAPASPATAAGGVESVAMTGNGKSREIRLAARPDGFPKDSDFELAETPIPEPGDGEVLVRNVYISVDPYMRARMTDRKSYMPSFQVGHAMQGGAVGQVVKSRSDVLAEGDWVNSMMGWREHYTADGAALMKIDPELAPVSKALGVLGLTGFTA